MGTNSGGKHPSTAKAFRERNRRMVELPSGEAVVVRKLTAEFLLLIREMFEAFLVADERGAKLRLTAAQNKQYVEALLCAAVVSPPVVPRAQVLGDNEMHVDDFGADLDPLVAAVNDFNGEVLVMPFRATADESVVAPAGGGVPDAPERAPAGATEGSADGPDRIQ